MPIIIKDFDWKETENTVTIRIPLRGVHQSKADVFLSRGYVKVSFEQFFFEALLKNGISVERSLCTLTPTDIVFELSKTEPLLWGELEKDVPKPEKLQLKKIFIDEEHQRIQQELEERKNRKYELKRVAVQEQIRLDTQQREELENLKKTEERNAINGLQLNCPRVVPKAIKKSAPVAVPVRSSRTLTVNFTPREFPTPSRESRIEEENEWLRKQTEARRSAGFISEDIRPEERNPQFMKDKGDEFMKSDNYLGAISAYSFGIKLNDKFADLYVGRSGAHLALGNYHRTVQDCSRALELLLPKVELNLKERALCIGRRGIGLIKLGIVKQGIDELKASLRLLPNEYFEKELNETEQ